MAADRSKGVRRRDDVASTVTRMPGALDQPTMSLWGSTGLVTSVSRVGWSRLFDGRARSSQRRESEYTRVSGTFTDSPRMYVTACERFAEIGLVRVGDITASTL